MEYQVVFKFFILFFIYEIKILHYLFYVYVDKTLSLKLKP